jgi:hypothetical protein
MERKNKLELMAIVHQIINSEEYQLNSNYMEKFSSRSKLASRILSIIIKGALIFAYTSATIFTAIAYFDSKMNFSIFIMSIWFAILVICFYYVFTVLFVCSAYMYTITLYILYGFQQVQDLIEVYLERGITYKHCWNFNNIHIS